MKIAFRTDSSLQIGSGHVMRCLTLAEALRAHGAQCNFISRAHPGHIFDTIRQRGFTVNALPVGVSPTHASSQAVVAPPLQIAHAAWLCCDWQTDAAQTGDILATLKPEWLITDHYALAQPWEEALKPHYKKLMVIDDLADRAHSCDLLLDQNLGRQPQDYADLVPAACQVLIGPLYALLRPEFATLRAYSLKRRTITPQLKKLLISMGGVDLPNATGQVLEALKDCPLPADCRITVVMGETAPWIKQVRALAKQMPWPTEVLMNITDMALRMANSDLAIGAAGATSWERCCLGLPAIVLVLAENQIESSEALQIGKLAIVVPKTATLQTELAEVLMAGLRDISLNYPKISRNCAATCDGCGAQRLTDILEYTI